MPDGEIVSKVNAPLDWFEIKQRASRFVNAHKNDKSEQSQRQVFWHEFFQIFGITTEQVGAFEQHVKKIDGADGSIDYFWPGKLIIEHKSRGKDLDDAYQQAIDYTVNLTKAEFPRYIIVSDFARIRLYDLAEFSETEIRIEKLVDNVELFAFMAGYNKTRIEGQHPVNIKAAEMMGKLYDLLKESNYPEEHIDKYLVRLVFCLFSEDAGIFEKNIFNEYVGAYSADDGTNTGSLIDSVFSLLNTPLDRRQKSLSSHLSKFPYVNGGLFAERLEMAYFDSKMRDCIIEASKLNWKEISPAIFGSLFQCVMNPAQRREMGAHYTSEENILKVINPLFMDDLRAEFNQIRNNKDALKNFVLKLSKIKIMDPACGCGNFLIISFRELKLLELEVYEALYGETAINRASRITVDNFYGIEYEAFPAQIAQIAMWLMEHLMNLKRMEKFGQCDSIIPLKSHANIHHGNSLTIDWSDVVDPNELTYIVGNPPFVGARLQTKEQSADLERVIPGSSGNLDYVSGWYVKASNFMELNPKLRTAYVSTNSIVQGEQVSLLWQPIFEKGFKINFAYPTFKWNNEARGNAAVHVIIIGFSKVDSVKTIYTHSNGLTGEVKSVHASNINAYLVDGPDVFIENRKKPLCDVPKVVFGNMPNDGGYLLLSDDEKQELIQQDPNAVEFVRPFLGAKEFINGIPRWCIWVTPDMAPSIRKSPLVKKRVEQVKEYRLASKRKETRALGSVPYAFGEIRQQDAESILIPRHSGESREYIPLGFISKDTIIGDSNLMLPNATLYHFGLLTSKMHMVWMRYVCGRLKSDYRYSVGIVYNNFPWPKYSEQYESKIANAAQEVLNIRARYEGQSLADLYDPLTMPADLIKAHQTLDRIVEKAYCSEPFKDDNQRISFMFERYLQLSNTASKLC